MISSILAIVKFCTWKETAESDAQHVLRWRKWYFAQIAIGLILTIGLLDWAASPSGMTQSTQVDIWPYWVPQVTIAIGIITYLYSLAHLPKKPKHAPSDAALNVEEQEKVDRWMASTFGTSWLALSKRQQTIDTLVMLTGAVVLVMAASPFMGRPYSALPLSLFQALALAVVGLLIMMVGLILAVIQSKAYRNIRL